MTMELINKSAVVAEIEKCYNECLKRAKIIDSEYWNAKADAYCNALVILDETTEVKEVDLEEEMNKWRQKHFKGIGYILDGSGEWLERTSQLDIAKHFYELGLKAKGE